MMKHDHLNILWLEDLPHVNGKDHYYVVTVALPSGDSHRIEIGKEDYDRLRVRKKW